MARMGMDVEAVEQIGRGLQSDADQLAALTSRIDALVRRLPGLWDGTDANDFVSSWWPQHRASLQAARSNVAGLGQSALNNASEQRGVSESGALLGAGTAVAAAGVATGPGGSPAQPATPAAPGHAYPDATGGAERYTAALQDKSSIWAKITGGDYAYQCVSWAKFRRAEMGLPYVPGNGGEQAANTAQAYGGLISGDQATAGSLVSSPGGNHVMVVEDRLSTDPPSYRISEMNVGPNPAVGTPEKFRDDSVLTQRADGAWSVTRRGGTVQVYRDLQFCRGL